MNCNNCGAYIEDGASFCGFCGKNINEDKKEASKETTGSTFPPDNSWKIDNVPDNKAGTDAGKKNEKLPLIIAGGVVGGVALICVIVIAVFAFMKNKPQQPEIQVTGDAVFTYNEEYINSEYKDLRSGMRARVVDDVPDGSAIEMRDYPSAEAEVMIEIDETEFVDVLEDYMQKPQK